MSHHRTHCLLLVFSLVDIRQLALFVITTKTGLTGRLWSPIDDLFISLVYGHPYRKPKTPKPLKVMAFLPG